MLTVEWAFSPLNPRALPIQLHEGEWRPHLCDLLIVAGCVARATRARVSKKLNDVCFAFLPAAAPLQRGVFQEPRPNIYRHARP